MHYLLILCSLGLLSGCGRGSGVSSQEGRARDARLRAAAEEILPWMQDQSAFLVSPDGTQLLVKREIGDGDTELHLTQLNTGKLIGRHAGGYPLLISWRPGYTSLSFVKDNHGDRNYRLMFWSPEDGKVILPNAPVLHSAHRLMRWSPDGRRLGFCAAEQAMQSGPLLVLDAASPENEPSVALQATDILDYAWSPDSQKLAVVTASDPGNVAIVDVREKTLNTIALSADCAIANVVWTQDGAGLIVASSQSGKNTFALRKVDIVGKTSHVICNHESRIGDITPLEDGRIVFRAVSEGMGKLMVSTRNDDPELLDFGEGTTSLMAVNEAQKLLYAFHTGLVSPRSLYEMNLDTRASRLIFQPWQVKGVRGIASQKVQISAPNGQTFPILVWKAAARPSRGVIITFPTRRDDVVTPTFSGSIQYRLQRGYDYIAFNFQPNGGWDINELDIESSLAVIDYARKHLGASPEHTVLFGGSNATVYIIETARRMREKAGAMVLRGITRSHPVDGEGEFDHKFRIAVLQGENDPVVTPEMARAYVEGVFGSQALSGANGFFHTLQNEGHTLRLLSSRSLISAAIFELLEP